MTDTTATSFPSSGQPNLSCTVAGQVFLRASTDPLCAGCISNLTALSKNRTVQLTWALTGANHYNVYRNTSSGGPYIKIGTAISTQTVYFDFNESALTLEATTRLQENLKCIQSVPGRKQRREGHCDPRGTEEYNLALGDRRAQSVKRYIERLGVEANRMRAVSKGKLEATGSNETAWAKDRKVQFIWE